MTDPSPALGGPAERPADQAAAPTTSGWQRFLDQKTAPQRFLVATSAVVAGVATLAGAVFGLTRIVHQTGGAEAVAVSGTTSDGARTIVRQGSAEADDLVRSVLTATGASGAGRLPLTHLVYERPGFLPFDSGDIVLLYNCRGQPVGNDNCNQVRLQFPDQAPPAVVNSADGDAGDFLGTYALRAPAGQLFGSNFDVQFNNVDK